MTDVAALQDKLAKAKRLMEAGQEQRKLLQEKIRELKTALTGRDAKIYQLQKELEGWEKDEKYRDRFARADAEVARLQTILARRAVKIEE